VNTPRVPIAKLSTGELKLDREVSHYVSRVLRLSHGDRFVAFDPEARCEAAATLLLVAKENVTVSVAPLEPATLVPERAVTIIQCVGKGSKLSAVVRDASELSATLVLPAVSKYSVAERGSAAAHARLARIAVEAARQCGRGDVLRVEASASLGDILGRFSSGRRVALHPTGAPLRDALVSLGRKEPVVLLIGPEGGLAPEELALASDLGFMIASLGPLVLRTETAAAAALGALLVV